MPIRTYMCPMDAAETTSRSIISTTTFKCSSGRDISIRTSRLIDLTQVGAARDCFSCGWTVRLQLPRSALLNSDGPSSSASIAKDYTSGVAAVVVQSTAWSTTMGPAGTRAR